MVFTRRNLLRALGLAGPAYFLTSGRGRRAQAVDASIPTRILFFYTPHGTLLRQWVAAPPGASAPTETNFALGPVLQPLSAWQNQLLLLEGLDMMSLYSDKTSATNAHVNGQTHALSAISRSGGASAGGISIDEYIAQGINSPSPVTPVPILEMSARANAGVAPYLTSWSGPAELDPPMTDPGQVYDRLFPNGPPSTASQSTAASVAQHQKSILDATIAEFNAVKAPLSSADQNKLNAHASLIRDLETQLALSGSGTATCSAPTRASVATAYKADCPYGAGASCITDASSAFINLAVAALACDITRVVTLDIDQMPSAQFGVPDIHNFLHGMDDVYWYANQRWGSKLTVQSTAQDSGNIATAVAFYQSYSKILANILQALHAVPESDGTTLLDHTIVVWCGEIGSPGHINVFMNYVLAGGGGVPFPLGRYVSMPRTPTPSNLGEQFPTVGVPHNDLFVSLANFMGLKNTTTFGDPKVCTGPLTQLAG
jgi:uncharacterized protein DUF1552